MRYLGRHRCIDGQGQECDHPADGWIVSPDGKRISVMCQHHAQTVIDEYREKLGEEWTFEAGRLEQ